MIGVWNRLSEEQNRDAWDRFYRRFDFAATGGRPERAIREPSPSITFGLGPVWDAEHPGRSDAAIEAVEDSARRAFLAVLGTDVELLVLDWQHQGFRVRPAETAPADQYSDGWWTHPTAVPDGDYYIYASADLSEGTFGHPWEQSLCVFGRGMTRTLGTDLRTWLPVIRERPE